MKKNISLIFLLFVVGSGFAQTLLSSATCSIQLVIESYDGNNGVAVAYNPLSKNYYAVYAGNAQFALETFRENGEFVATQDVGFDVRGMWFNEKNKQLEGITYSNNGTFSMEISNSGMIGQGKSNVFDYGQPANSVMTFNQKQSSVLYVSESGTATIYKLGKKKSKEVNLQLGSNADEFNLNGPIYTSVKGKEIGLLNWKENTVYFFDQKSGKNTGKVSLQIATCSNGMNAPTYFCVSYCNDKVWLYDKESRTWFGFDIWSN